MGTETVYLREGRDSDALLVMTWRSNPLIYQGFLKQTAPLRYENHIDWWHKPRDWKQWIIVYGEGEYQRDVGQVNIQNLNTDCPEIGYFIGEIPLWGKGIATVAIRLAIDWLRQQGYEKVCADVKVDNASSKRLLKKLGFVEVTGRDGLDGFELKL